MRQKNQFTYRIIHRFIREIRVIRGCSSLALLALLALLLLALAFPVLAQQVKPELKLTLKRDFGYGGGNRIQGLFTLRAAGPPDLARVVFFIDEKPLGEDTESPFQFQFSTDSYALGMHTLSSVGYTQVGLLIASNNIRIEFVSAAEGWRTVRAIVVPLLVIVFGLVCLSFVVPWLLGRGKLKSLPPGEARSYGLLGGTICPKCGRPFAIHIYGLKLLAGKLDRCPYCGRWSLVRRASPLELKQAESAELEQAVQPEPALSPEVQLRRDMEGSRYEDV